MVEEPTIMGTVKFALIIMLVVLILLLFGPELRPLIEMLVNWIINVVK